MRIGPGVAVAALASALLLASGAGARSAQTVTIELTSVIAQRTDHDLPPRGKLSKGDYASFKDLLLNRKKQFGKRAGMPVGYDVGTIVSNARKRIILPTRGIYR